MRSPGPSFHKAWWEELGLSRLLQVPPDLSEHFHPEQHTGTPGPSKGWHISKNVSLSQLSVKSKAVWIWPRVSYVGEGARTEAETRE